MNADINNYLPYNPGVLPSKPCLKIGEQIEIVVSGYPPYKDISFSIRNIKHKHYSRFVKLREEAIKVMDRRAWSHSGVRMCIEIHAPSLEKGKKLIDYIGGVADSLGGSSGFSFTYLPIVYEDDCQICVNSMEFIQDDNIWYKVEIEILTS